ncbi:hypothetical protein BCV70DRAFT_198954 [Testicularia cyperi]|uniref:Uncharacterized protein n=1 Tax=Testicularia cyperi TaxID=1882483 RepID=A0A317XTZ7_9BASI|nr:hypothetical protein BCV70DRAFT_198954 [Testicularia cyperi]
MPEPIPTTTGANSTPASTNGHSADGPEQSSTFSAIGSTPLELLRAVKEVQERRVAVWKEYEDAFELFLHPPSSIASGPVNGSQNGVLINDDIAGSSSIRVESNGAEGDGAEHNHSASASTSASVSASTSDPRETGRGCGACASTSSAQAAPGISSDLMSQILQITTQALIECSHRLRSIQTELQHSSVSHLAHIVDAIQSEENSLLRSTVARDQLRQQSSASSSSSSSSSSISDSQAMEKIAELQQDIHHARAEIASLMQDVYAESLELAAAQD